MTRSTIKQLSAGLLLVGTGLIIYHLFGHSFVHAADIQIIPSEKDVPGLPSVTATPASLVAQIFRITITLSAGIFLVLLLFGGVSYMVSAGNEEGTGKAKKIMTNALIGLLIIVMSYGIGLFILKLLGFKV